MKEQRYLRLVQINKLLALFHQYWRFQFDHVSYSQVQNPDVRQKFVPELCGTFNVAPGTSILHGLDFTRKPNVKKRSNMSIRFQGIFFLKQDTFQNVMMSFLF